MSYAVDLLLAGGRAALAPAGRRSKLPRHAWALGEVVAEAAIAAVAALVMSARFAEVALTSQQAHLAAGALDSQ